ncbi:MAG: hypothetical protein JWN27_410, partial [Candidatus Eremiobacteraeota bacterium]|nr:hypothetical protein [Candidatus Eremiobacteraeota bacterium]
MEICSIRSIEAGKKAFLRLRDAVFCIPESGGPKCAELHDVTSAIVRIAPPRHELCGFQFIKKSDELSGIRVDRLAKGLLG